MLEELIMREYRTDIYPDWPVFTPEEIARIDKFLKEMERKYGSLSPRGRNWGSLPFLRKYSFCERYLDDKKVYDAEITAGERKKRRLT